MINNDHSSNSIRKRKRLSESDSAQLNYVQSNLIKLSSSPLNSMIIAVFFMKSVVGQTKNIKIISNVYKDYGADFVEEIYDSPIGTQYVCHTRTDDMIPENDIYIIKASVDNPVTFDAIINVLIKITDQIIKVNERNLSNACYCGGFMYESLTNAYELKWY